MKKVLIWDISFKLANVGGPAGYLYNIHEYLKEHPNPQITFLSDLSEASVESETVVSSNSTLKDRILSNSFVRTLNDILFLVWKSYRRCNVRLPEGIDLDAYDFIHFHQTNDVTRYRRLLRHYHGKTILTSHCPCLRTDEILSLRPHWYKVLRPLMLAQEMRGYKVADHLMFPCKEAREPYEKERRVKRLFSSMESKFFYVPTAILDISVDANHVKPLSDYGIPDDAFVIAYFGRHNYIKGYDILKELGGRLLERIPNLYILCAGRGEIEPPRHPRWIELGFVNNTHEILAQCSLYVLPNRETYFDLVALEVLRAGLPIAMAENGGNRYFKTLPEQEIADISFFDVENQKESEDVLLKRIGCNNNMKPSLNRKLWEKYFTLEKYVSLYCNNILS